VRKNNFYHLNCCMILFNISMILISLTFRNFGHKLIPRTICRKAHVSYELYSTACGRVNIPGSAGLHVSILHCPLFLYHLSHAIILKTEFSNVIFRCCRIHLTTPTIVFHCAPILLLRNIDWLGYYNTMSSE